MKTIKVSDLGIEVETEIHDKGKPFSEIKIPKGWRLLKVNEAIYLHNNPTLRKGLNLENTWEFIEQPFKLNKKRGYVSRLDANSVGADLSCCGDPRFSFSDLGIRFCRDLKEKGNHEMQRVWKI